MCSAAEKGPVFHYSEQRHKRKRQLRPSLRARGLSVLTSKRGIYKASVAMARGDEPAAERRPTAREAPAR